MKRLAVAALFLLSACAQMAEYQRQAAEAQRQQDIQRCVDFGYRYGTDAHADCMMQLYRERQEDERRRQDQYADERMVEEMKSKDCKSSKKRIPHPDGSFEVVERTVCN